MSLVSVIIPVYNVEKYLERCVKSVFSQTYTDLEIILVDDGSTDNSGKICDSFKEQDNRIRVIHKINGGLSDARNAGLKVCKGEFIFFLDSDDYITADCIAYSKTILDKTLSDISIVGWTHNENDLSSTDIKDTLTILNKNDALQYLLYQKISTSADSKLYKKRIFENLSFPVGKLYEDVVTVFQAFEKANKVVQSNLNKYYYFVRTDSIITSKFSNSKLDYIKNCEMILNIVKEKYPILKKSAESRLLWASIHIWVNIDDRKKFKYEYTLALENIKKYRIKTLLDFHVPKKNKMIIALTFLGWNITRKIYLTSKGIKQ